MNSRTPIYSNEKLRELDAFANSYAVERKATRTEDTPHEPGVAHFPLLMTRIRRTFALPRRRSTPARTEAARRA